MDCASGAVRWKARKRLTKPVVSDRRTWHVRGRRRPRTRSDCILAPTKAAEGRRTPGRWRAASQAGRRRCVWMRGGLPKNARSPKPKSSAIGRGRARASAPVNSAILPAGASIFESGVAGQLVGGAHAEAYPQQRVRSDGLDEKVADGDLRFNRFSQRGLVFLAAGVALGQGF